MKTGPFSRNVVMHRGMKIKIFHFNKKHGIEYMAIVKSEHQDYTQRGDTEEEAIENLFDKIKFHLWERCQP